MKNLQFLLVLFASMVVLAACSEEEDPLKLTINLPLNETMAWQGAFINYWTDSTVLALTEYFEITLTDTMMLNDTLFFEGTAFLLRIGNNFHSDTIGSILISKTSVYLQQNFLPVYPFLFYKQNGEQPAVPTETRLQRVLMPVSLTEEKKQSFTHPSSPFFDGWRLQESIVSMNPLGQKSVGPFSGMGVKVEYRVSQNDFTTNMTWLLDKKGKIWTMADYGSFIKTDSLGNEITRSQNIVTRHRISKQNNPEAYLKTLTLSDFYVTGF